MQRLTGSSSQTAPAPTGSRKVYLLELCENRLFMTKAGSASAVTYEIGDQDGYELGTYTEDIVIHIAASNLTTNFGYTVKGEYSNNGGASWALFSGGGNTGVITGPNSANGNVNSAPYTTRADFGLLVRFKLDAAPTSGTALETGTLTLTARIMVFT